MISGGTTHPTETWTFIEWLSRQPITTPLQSFPPNYYNTRKSSDIQQSADGIVDKRYQSAYEYTIANLPPVSAPVYDGSQEFPLVEVILGSPDLLFNTPPLTAEAIVAQNIELIQSSNEQRLTNGPSPTPDMRPIIVATPVH